MEREKAATEHGHPRVSFQLQGSESWHPPAGEGTPRSSFEHRTLPVHDRDQTLVSEMGPPNGRKDREAHTSPYSGIDYAYSSNTPAPPAQVHSMCYVSARSF